jgi:hypothetical protein
MTAKDLKPSRRPEVDQVINPVKPADDRRMKTWLSRMDYGRKLSISARVVLCQTYFWDFKLRVFRSGHQFETIF